MAVWINIRTTPVPDVPCMVEVLDRVALDERRFVRGGFSRGFFLRSVVLASDGRTLLNPQSGGASLGKLFADGHFAYAQVKPEDYLRMLREALDRAEGSSHPRGAFGDEEIPGDSGDKNLTPRGPQR